MTPELFPETLFKFSFIFAEIFKEKHRSVVVSDRTADVVDVVYVNI